MRCAPLVVIFPNAFPATGWSYEKDGGATGGQDCVWVDNIVLPPMEIVLDIHEASESVSILYPNPNHGDFTIVPSRISQVCVFNLTGQKILTVNEVNGSQQLHLDAAGIYFVRISNEDGVETKKVVVE